MTLKNKLGLTSSTELANAEEKISKNKAHNLFRDNILKDYPPGTFQTLALFINTYLKIFMNCRQNTHSKHC